MIVVSDDISLSCLPTRDMEGELLEGEYTTVTGWGVTLDSGGGAADVPNYYHDVPVINNDVCDENLLTLGVNDEMICTDSTGVHGVCNGDSGGPLNMQPAQGDYSSYIQVGIASFVANDGCDTERPNVFARVTSFLDLIEERTGYIIE